MTANSSLPNSDHVMRFVPKGRQHRDPDTDEFIGLIPQAMQLRENDKGGLSVTWVEHFGAYGLAAKREAAIAYRETLRTRHIGREAVFASAQVQAIVDAGLRYSKGLVIVHDPVPGNPGHAEIRRFTDDDLTLLDLLATEIFTEIDKVADLNLPKIPGT
jgi:hypothetical protein